MTQGSVRVWWWWCPSACTFAPPVDELAKQLCAVLCCCFPRNHPPHLHIHKQPQCQHTHTQPTLAWCLPICRAAEEEAAKAAAAEAKKVREAEKKLVKKQRQLLRGIAEGGDQQRLQCEGVQQCGSTCVAECVMYIPCLLLLLLKQITAAHKFVCMFCCSGQTKSKNTRNCATGRTHTVCAPPLAQLRARACLIRHI